MLIDWHTHQQELPEKLRVIEHCWTRQGGTKWRYSVIAVYA